MISGTPPLHQQKQQIHLQYLQRHIGDSSELRSLQENSNYFFNEQDSQSNYSQQIKDNHIEEYKISSQNANNSDQNVKVETQIDQKIDSKQDINKIQSQITSQSTGINLSISSLEIDPQNTKLFDFLKNIAFLLALQLVGPFLTTYFIWKYEFLKNLPLSLKIKTIIHITLKSTVLSLMIWIVIVSLFMGDDITNQENYMYYKIEFIVNVLTTVLATIGGAVLGKNALFNNKFFSELYYLSEQKLKKIMTNKINSSSQAKLRFFSSLQQTFMGNICCEQPQVIEHPLDNFQANGRIEVFETIQRKRKIEERMTKVMKKLYIDSQTFIFTLLPFSLDNPLQKKITASCHQRKQSTEQQQGEELDVTYQCPQVGQRSRKMFRRLQTIKIQELKLGSQYDIQQNNDEQINQNVNY